MKHLRWIILILAVLSLAVLSHGLSAQTATSDEEAGDAVPVVEDLVRRVEIVTAARMLTAVPENTPIPIDLALVQVPGVERKLTEGVTAKAYTRHVVYEGELIGQVVLTAVEKNGRYEPLTSSQFVAQFEMSSPELDPTRPVMVDGNQDELVAALMRLDQEDEAPKEEERRETVIASDPDSRAGPSAPKNDEASKLDSSPVVLPPVGDKTETVRVTTEGCAVRVDVDQMAAIQQARVETMKGGDVSTTECADGGDRYPLNRSYNVCGDAIDMEARTATARYVLYYTSPGGARQEVSECVNDEEKVFPISEKVGSCPMFLDYADMQAVPQSALVYTNATNAEVQVRGCQASETKPAAPMTRTTNGCSIRHDFGGGKSFQQGMWTYQLDGIHYQAGGCTDTGVEYAHAKVYENAAGGYVCQPVVDLQAGAVTLASRIQINVAGVNQYVTDCTPDTGAAIPVVATTDGCANPATWEHDLAAGQSYGSERYYYTKGNGQREYVTNCQNSQTVYPHQVEIAGWQNHDGQLFAYPLTTVFIGNTPQGRYNIKTAEVLQGAQQQVYQLTGTTTVWNGQSEFAGCDELRLTDLVEVWRRPDDTNHNKTIGTGAPIGPINACSTVVQTPVWALESMGSAVQIGQSTACQGWCNFDGSDYCCGGYVTTYSCRRDTNYRGSRILLRSDGAQVTQASSNLGARSHTWSVSTPGVYCSTVNTASTPSETWVGQEVYTWNQAAGW